MFKSIDGGETWTEITRNAGLPTGLWGNIGITVWPAKPSRLWAIIENDNGGVYRSDDAGATWTRVNARSQAAPARLVLLEDLRRPEGHQHRVRVQRELPRVARRRQDVPQHPRAARRQSRSLDRAERQPKRMIEANDGGANVTHQRRPHVDRRRISRPRRCIT